jgi:hypothetical protein
VKREENDVTENVEMDEVEEVDKEEDHNDDEIHVEWAGFI